MTLLHIFATNVKRYRVAQGLSQEKLAELSGLHRTYISSLERERRNISIENIESISKALNVDPQLLFINFEEEDT
jgi:transcriptional regulator with XRE-family HTH domain